LSSDFGLLARHRVAARARNHRHCPDSFDGDTPHGDVPESSGPAAEMGMDNAGRNIMGWTAGHLQGPFTARTAIEFDLGAEFAERVIDAVRYGQVIYAAVRSNDGQEVFGLVLLTERRGGPAISMHASGDGAVVPG
jgi:hypothetical protein